MKLTKLIKFIGQIGSDALTPPHMQQNMRIYFELEIIRNWSEKNTRLITIPNFHNYRSTHCCDSRMYTNNIMSNRKHLVEWSVLPVAELTKEWYISLTIKTNTGRIHCLYLQMKNNSHHQLHQLHWPRRRQTWCCHWQCAKEQGQSLGVTAVIMRLTRTYDLCEEAMYGSDCMSGIFQVC